jgi:hypothetical protein
MLLMFNAAATPLYVCTSDSPIFFHLLIHLDFGAYRAETAVAGQENVVYFTKVIWTGKGCIAKTVWLPTAHDLPDVVSQLNSDKVFVCREELIPVSLENLFECESVFADGFHGEEVYTISHSCLPIAPKGRHALKLRGIR